MLVVSRRSSTFLLLLYLTLAGLQPVSAEPYGEFDTEITLRSAAQGKKVKPLPPERLKAALESRLSVLGGVKGTVRVDADGTAHIRVPAGRYTETQLHWLSRAGKLEMVWLPTVQNAQLTEAPLAVSVFLAQGRPTYRFFDTRQQKFVPVEVVLKQAKRIAGGQDLEPKGATLVGTEDTGLVSLQFTPSGMKKIAAFSKAHPRDTVAFTLDGEIVAGPLSIPPPTEVKDASGRLIRREAPFSGGVIQVLPVLAEGCTAAFLPAILNGGELPFALQVVDQKEVRDDPVPEKDKG